MTIWEALLLGIIQGVTEFLPVSSSGHLILFQHLLGYKNLSHFVFFDLICHLGTLGAILIVFRKEIKQTLSSPRIWKVLIALVPLVPLAPFVKSIQSVFDDLQLLGYGFLATAFILFLGNRFRKPLKAMIPKQPSFKEALLIGTSQAFAIVPGISRSGTTITAGCMLGLSPTEAVAFSFILSIPTILGGMVLESYKVLSQGIESTDWILYAVGFLSAFIIGYGSLKGLLWIIKSAKFKYFSWYCAFIGILILYHFSK